MPFAGRQYVIVDDARRRRNSAPGYLSSHATRNAAERRFWLRSSTSDLSVLPDNRSESGSSLELDTSNLSPESSPLLADNDKNSDSPRGSYQSVHVVNFDVFADNASDHSACRYACSRFIWKAVLLSQMVALCFTVVCLSSQYARSENRDAIGPCFAHYLFLGMLWTPKLAGRSDEHRNFLQVFKLSGLRYVLLSLLHVEANYFLVSSLQRKSYMGNQMINLVAATLSLVLAYVGLDMKFQLTHAKGFIVVVFGAAGFCVANAAYKTEGEEEINWGDVLRVGSGIFLAVNNLAEELIVKSIDSVEYLGMIGFLGSFISGLQTIFSEEIKIIAWDRSYCFSMVTFSVFQFIFSCLTPRLLRDIGTTGLHLSLISSEFYAYFINSLIDKSQLQFLYLVSYGFIMAGSYMFVLKRTSIGTHYFLPVKVVVPKGS